MPKTQLTKEKRNLILDFMVARFKENHDRSEYDTTFSVLTKMVNDVLRSKYDEKDMEVLRKYKLTSVDACMRFRADGGKFFGIDFRDYFGYGSVGDVEVSKVLSDIPNRAGCRSGEVFSCSDDLAELAEKFDRMHQEQKSMFSKKERDYESFLMACKTVEDVEAVVVLPQVLRTRLGKSPNALLAINPDTVETIRLEFASVEVAA